jgi:flagellar motility protein MotE (MotC chaperone)
MEGHAMMADEPVVLSSPRRFGRLQRVDEEKLSSTSFSAISKASSPTSGLDEATAEKRQDTSPHSHPPLPRNLMDSSKRRNTKSPTLEKKGWERTDELRRECEELEAIILEKRNFGRVMKMKTALAMSSYQNRIDSLTREKDSLQKHCLDLQEKVADLRRQHVQRLKVIYDVEDGSTHVT